MKLSAVVVARNDNYGGNLNDRATYCLNSLIDTFDEVILVDWNSPNNRPLLWDQEDDITLTSKGYIWAYPGKQPIKNSIAVLPELNKDDLTKVIGICSDYIKDYE